MKHFDKVEVVKFEGRNTKNPYAFRYYDKNKVVLGKPMSEHLKFSVAYWHTMVYGGTDPFGDITMSRTWHDDDPLVEAENKVHAAFELFQKLGIEYFCFHDVDIAPKGKNINEFFENLDHITDLIKEKMDETGIKLLWNTANLFTDEKYVHGAATAADPKIYAQGAMQIKKALDISKKLDGENYVFWGGREGYDYLLNTKMDFELKNFATMLKISLEYAESIGHNPQFLLEPKPKEPTTHQYDYDAATTIAFLRQYDLLGRVKLNLEANHATLAGHTFAHEIRVAADNGVLGSLDANQGNLLLGWDVDEFPTDVLDTTLSLYEVIKAGGLGTGGINFDAKVRRGSFDQEDLVLAHIAGMDTYARALLSVEKLMEDNFIEEIIEHKYRNFDSEIGEKINSGKITLTELVRYGEENPISKAESSKMEYYLSRLNDYLV